jgi:lysophospholipase L1-like esterase
MPAHPLLVLPAVVLMLAVAVSAATNPPPPRPGLPSAVRPAPGAPQRLPAPFPDGARLLFLGDEVTAEDGYVALFDAYLRTRHPGVRLTVLNRALPGETLSSTGLLARLDRVLAETRPTAVYACYGRREGGPAAGTTGVPANFISGYARLLAATRQARVPLTFITPPAADPAPPPAALHPAATLGRLAAWLAGRADPDARVVDAHGFVAEQVRLRRLDEPGFTVTGAHGAPDATGHLLMALALLRQLPADPNVATALVNGARRLAVGLEVGDAAFQESGAVRFRWRSGLPLPQDADWNTNVLHAVGFGRHFNHLGLRATNLRAPAYDLEVDGTVAATFTAASLFEGVDLAAHEAWPPAARAAEFWTRLRAWRAAERAAGLGRGPAAGLDAQEAELRRLAAPKDYIVNLLPVTTE